MTDQIFSCNQSIKSTKRQAFLHLEPTLLSSSFFFLVREVGLTWCCIACLGPLAVAFSIQRNVPPNIPAPSPPRRPGLGPASRAAHPVDARIRPPPEKACRGDRASRHCRFLLRWLRSLPDDGAGVQAAGQGDRPGQGGVYQGGHVSAFWFL